MLVSESAQSRRYLIPFEQGKIAIIYTRENPLQALHSSATLLVLEADFSAEIWTMADVGGVASDRLKSFIERIERLEEEKEALSGDLREVYSEAKGTGFDVKVMRQIIRLRKMDSSDRSEMEELIDVYKRALEML